MIKTYLFLAAAVVLLAGWLLVGAASAETRIFLLENSDGYGVDTCLAKGEPCGEQLASAWCRVHDYSSALDFGQVTTETTGAVRPVASEAPPAAPACTGRFCPTMVAITCSR